MLATRHGKTPCANDCRRRTNVTDRKNILVSSDGRNPPTNMQTTLKKNKQAFHNVVVNFCENKQAFHNVVVKFCENKQAFHNVVVKLCDNFDQVRLVESMK